MTGIMRYILIQLILFIPMVLQLECHGPTSYLSVRWPSFQELEDSPWIELTSEMDWDPYGDDNNMKLMSSIETIDGSVLDNALSSYDISSMLRKHMRISSVQAS